MGCCGGGKTYARPTTPTQGSQHAPVTQQPRVNHSPQTASPKVVQSAALAQRRAAVVRRQV